MLKSFTCILIFTAFVLAMTSCSQPAPVAPQFAPERLVESDNHELIGYFHLYIDPLVPSVEVVPARSVAKHANVKTYLNPPNCYDCITMTPIGPYQDKIIPVNITLKNPTPLTGYDVRGILLSTDPGADLDNPDDYTTLFGDGLTPNPFKAFAKSALNRAFGAGESFTEQYDVYLSSFGKVMAIDYAVDANYPGRAKEPYEISIPIVDGEIDNKGNNIVGISVDVFAAGDDVDEVVLDASAMFFADDLTFTHGTGNTWELDFQNTPKAQAGTYTLMIKASTSSSTQFLYDYFDVTVIQVVTSLANDIQPIFDAECIGCHGTVAPPLGLDLTSGHTYSSTVNVASVQAPSFKLISPGEPQFSYLCAKIRGTHLIFPFDGSGDRMPKDGPPYLTPLQETTVLDWVIAGALDN